jgi:hypothetical protein
LYMSPKLAKILAYIYLIEFIIIYKLFKQIENEFRKR